MGAREPASACGDSTLKEPTGGGERVEGDPGLTPSGGDTDVIEAIVRIATDATRTRS